MKEKTEEGGNPAKTKLKDRRRRQPSQNKTLLENKPASLFPLFLRFDCFPYLRMKKFERHVIDP